ncbi:uncharacterized protein HKW66_Vig0015120 [Vigna angularis]|uniref:Uncharacterized protein n=1 Tax=Phaseolus angularis TaxID=3914 RepID=A0A8T0LFM9_PHAAN|nr:uncharacterized protein HKW66_Vig0015120 [Vigna angularis]
MHLATRTPPFDTHALHLKRTHVHNACMLTNVTLERSKALMESKWQQAVGRSSCNLHSSLFCNSPPFAPFTFQHRKKRPCTVSFPSNRSVLDSETGKFHVLNHSSFSTCKLRFDLHAPSLNQYWFFCNFSLRSFGVLNVKGRGVYWNLFSLSLKNERTLLNPAKSLDLKTWILMSIPVTPPECMDALATQVSYSPDGRSSIRILVELMSDLNAYGEALLEETLEEENLEDDNLIEAEVKAEQ